MDEVQRFIEDIENGLTVTHGAMLRLVRYLREELSNGRQREDDVRGEPGNDAGLQDLWEALSPAVSRKERGLREYRFFRKTHKEWKEIESMMNVMAQNGWRLFSVNFVEGARVPYWYFTWELTHELSDVREGHEGSGQPPAR